MTDSSSAANSKPEVKKCTCHGMDKCAIHKDWSKKTVAEKLAIEEEFFICRYCGRKCKSKFSVERHQSRVKCAGTRIRKEEIPITYICGYCDEEFVDKDEFNGHFVRCPRIYQIHEMELEVRIMVKELARIKDVSEEVDARKREIAEMIEKNNELMRLLEERNSELVTLRLESVPSDGFRARDFANLSTSDDVFDIGRMAELVSAYSSKILEREILRGKDGLMDMYINSFTDSKGKLLYACTCVKKLTFFLKKTTTVWEEDKDHCDITMLTAKAGKELCCEEPRLIEKYKTLEEQQKIKEFFRTLNGMGNTFMLSLARKIVAKK